MIEPRARRISRTSLQLACERIQRLPEMRRRSQHGRVGNLALASSSFKSGSLAAFLEKKRAVVDKVRCERTAEAQLPLS
jgi:hypothetical protein